MFATITIVCAEPWDGSNNPASFQGDRNLNLAAFPTRADVSPTPWSDTYWPSYEGGIANRWNGDGKGFDYHLNTKDELQAGSVDIGTLSPAEKFDIYNGRYDYPLLNSEWQRVHPSDASWEGLCHGWAPAAYLFNQPGQAVLTNPDGIKVPFFSSDVKALLTYLMAQYGESSETDFLGTRCNTDLSANPAGENSTECRDINAGSILAIFGNQLGLKTQAFVADVDRGYQVWNQPISGYALELGSTRPCSTGASRSCQHEQEVQVAMSYTQETVPQTTAHDALTRQANYDLWVELDASGNIVGGWHNTWKRPDFVWTETRKDFSGYFAKLADVYAATTPNASTRLAAMPAAPHKTATRLPAGHGTFGLAAYRDAPHSVSWCVPAAPNGLRVSFDYLDTRRFRDTVTVYEADAECRRGAPVTVLHGPEHIHKLLTAQVPRGSGALITFTVDPRAGRAVSGSVGKGFRAHYENL